MTADSGVTLNVAADHDGTFEPRLIAKPTPFSKSSRDSLSESLHTAARVELLQGSARRQVRPYRATERVYRGLETAPEHVSDNVEYALIGGSEQPTYEIKMRHTSVSLSMWGFVLTEHEAPAESRNRTITA